MGPADPTELNMRRKGNEWEGEREILTSRLTEELIGKEREGDRKKKRGKGRQRGRKKE